MKGFEVRETSDLKNWMIGITEEHFENCPDMVCHGSYHIFAARLLGLSYPDFLRYCASQGGTLRGRTGFPTVYFKDRKIAEAICSLINKEYEVFLKEYKVRS